MRRLVPVALLVVLAGCGGGPGAPTPPVQAPPAPTFRDGWTEAPVSASISPAAPVLGSRVTVTAPGYLTREALFDGGPLYLWPQDEAYVRALVYNEFVPGGRLSRWAAGFTITASAELLADPRVRPVLEAAAAEAGACTGLPVTVGAAGTVSVELDASLVGQVAGRTINSFRGNSNEIVGARMLFADRDNLTGQGAANDNTLLHELGHVLGLGHVAGGVMESSGARAYQDRRFNDAERTALKLMYRWRRPGNLAPDRDAG
jgi:hypothetical protein